MAESEQSIDIRVRARDEASATFKKVAQEAKKELGGLKGLKGALGEESALGNTFKAVRGAGAVAGLTLGATVLRDAATAAADLRSQLDAGEISAGEMTERLMGILPVVGQFWQAGRAVRELFTGEEAAAKKIREEAEAGVKYMEARLALQKQATEAVERHADRVRQLRNELELLGLPPGAAKARASEQSFEEDEKKRQETVDAEVKKYRAAADAAANEVSAKLTALDAKRYMAQERVDQWRERVGDHPAKEPYYAEDLADLNRLTSEIETLQAKRAAIRNQEAKDVGRVQAEAATESRLAREKHDREQVKAIVDSAREVAKQWREAEDEIDTIRSEARERRLRAEGKTLDAELEQLRRKHRQRIGDERRQAQARADQFHPADVFSRARIADQLARKENELDSALQDDIAAARQKAYKDSGEKLTEHAEKRQREAERERAEVERLADLEQQRVDAARDLQDAAERARRRELEARGRAGEQALRELELTREIRQERERIEDVLRREATLDRFGKGRLTAAQEDEARGAIARLLGQEADVARLATRRPSGGAAAALAQAEDTPFGRGMAARFRSDLEANSTDPLLEEEKKQTPSILELPKAIAALGELLKNILTAIERGGAGAGAAAGVFSGSRPRR